MIDFLTLIEENLLIANEYLTKYQALIIKNKNTKKESFKTQVHHIIPKAAFKLLNTEVDESIANKVNLVYSDHILAHYYLAQCSKDQLKYGNIMALKHIFGNKYCNITEADLLVQLPDLQQLYEEAMLVQAAKTKAVHSGKIMSAEHKARISKANKGRIYVYNEVHEKLIAPEDFELYSSLGYVKGRRHRPTAETRALMSAHMKGAKKCSDYAREVSIKKALGSRWMQLDGRAKQVLPENVQEYLDNGWTFGRGKVVKKLIKTFKRS